MVGVSSDRFDGPQSVRPAPLGYAIGGWLVAYSFSAALSFAALVSAISAVTAFTLIPRTVAFPPKCGIRVHEVLDGHILRETSPRQAETPRPCKSTPLATIAASGCPASYQYHALTGLKSLRRLRTTGSRACQEGGTEEHRDGTSCSMLLRLPSCNDLRRAVSGCHMSL